MGSLVSLCPDAGQTCIRNKGAGIRSAENL